MDRKFFFDPVRWGSETQATHCSEGEAGHNDLSSGTAEDTQRSQSASPEFGRVYKEIARIEWLYSGSIVMRS